MPLGDGNGQKDRFGLISRVPGGQKYYDNKMGREITLPLNDEPNCACYHLNCEVGCKSCSSECKGFDQAKAKDCTKADKCPALVLVEA